MSKIPQDVLSGWVVVVVDDEQDSIDVASHILKFYGATVHSAANGQTGLATIRAVQPRFVITDLSMPEMDGWRLLEAVRQDPDLQHIPVIALTAHAMVGDREKALAAGFDNYLTKPLSAATFMHDLLTRLIAMPAFANEFDY